VKLDDLLKFQGITKQDLDSQIRIQIEVEKILSKDIKISDQDVTDYIASNSGKFTATDAATINNQAKAAILQDQISQKIQPWFDQVKKNTQVVRFVN
jgi:hypothetical protein